MLCASSSSQRASAASPYCASISWAISSAFVMNRHFLSKNMFDFKSFLPKRHADASTTKGKQEITKSIISGSFPMVELDELSKTKRRPSSIWNAATSKHKPMTPMAIWTSESNSSTSLRLFGGVQVWSFDSFPHGGDITTQVGLVISKYDQSSQTAIGSVASHPDVKSQAPASSTPAAGE